MKNGLSGAGLLYLHNTVLKYGSRNVALQGTHMRTVPHSAKVYAVGHSWYVMERCMPSPSYWPSMELIDMLDDIWSTTTPEPKHHPEWETNLRVYLHMVESPLVADLEAAIAAVRNVRPYNLHGDPTWENVLRKKNGDMVLIDCLPLQQRAYKPSHPIIDLAKMAQSFMGWEWFRHGWRIDKLDKRMFHSHVMQNTLNCDWLWWWTALCFERIRNSVHKPAPQEMKDFCTITINRLIETRDIYSERIES